jgi:hypothetical protein
MAAEEILRGIAEGDRLGYLQKLVLETAREVSGNAELEADAPLRPMECRWVMLHHAADAGRASPRACFA